MADLATGSSTFPATNDTFTNKTAGTGEIKVEEINGLASGILALEAFSANTSGSVNTRLAPSLTTQGGVPRGVAFPVSPTPVDGQPFILNNILHHYNLATGQWDSSANIPPLSITGGMIAANTIPDTKLIQISNRPKLPFEVMYEDELNTFGAENVPLNLGGRYDLARVIGGVTQPPVRHSMIGNLLSWAVDGISRLSWSLPNGINTSRAKLVDGSVALDNLATFTIDNGGLTTPDPPVTTAGDVLLATQVLNVLATDIVVVYYGHTFRVEKTVGDMSVECRVATAGISNGRLHSKNGPTLASISSWFENIQLLPGLLGSLRHPVNGCLVIYPVLDGGMTINFNRLIQVYGIPPTFTLTPETPFNYTIHVIPTA
jgi:hypothetical protein